MLKHVAAIPGVFVTMDTCKEKAMIVHLPNGNEIKFSEYVDGLYYYHTRKTKLMYTQVLQIKVLVYYPLLIKTNQHSAKNNSEQQTWPDTFNNVWVGLQIRLSSTT